MRRNAALRGRKRRNPTQPLPCALPVQDMAAEWKLGDDVLRPLRDPDARAAAEAARAAQYHGLALPLSDVLMVDSLQ